LGNYKAENYHEMASDLLTAYKQKIISETLKSLLVTNIMFTRVIGSEVIGVTDRQTGRQTDRQSVSESV
jgi:hypothetical protein